MKKLLFLIISFFALLPNFAFALGSSFGPGVQHSFYGEFSIDTLSGEVKVTLPDGKENIFTLDADFRYKSTTDNGLTLTTSLNTFLITDSESSREYVFSWDKHLLEKILFLDADRELNLVYDAQDRLHYVTDNTTNTIYFTYDDISGYVASMEDTYQNIMEFDYEQTYNTYLLKDIKFNGVDIPLQYDENGNITLTGAKLDFSFSSQEKRGKVYSVSEEGVLLNNGNGLVKYKIFEERLYSFYNGKIFSIKDGKRTSLVSQTGTLLEDVYVAPTGTLYSLVDGSINKYISEGKSISLLKQENIRQFVVSDDGKTIYFLDEFTPGYRVYVIEKKELTSLDISTRIGGLYMLDGTLVLSTGTMKKLWELHPEFGLKYKKKLDALAHKISKLSFSEAQKKHMLEDISAYRNKVMKSSADAYKKEKILFLLKSIEDIVNIIK